MNKELCFILENKNVYLDHILVDYEYVPIFLLCKDDECQYYLALCTNIENGEYCNEGCNLKSENVLESCFW